LGKIIKNRVIIIVYRMKNNFNQFFLSKYFLFYNSPIILPILILFLYLSPFFFLGENTFVLIHDMLDGPIVFYKVLSESGMIFGSSSSIIEQYMNVPRASLGNELDFILWLFYFFEPFTAYTINQTLIRLIAFIGMYLLLNRYVFQIKQKNYSSAISLLYALLPFYSSAGLSVAGLPLITYVFLNLRYGKDNKNDWFILFFFPFYSSFVLSMFFYIVFVSFIWLFDAFNKKVTKKFTIALSFFLILYLIINYRLIYIFVFGEGFISHRADFQPSSSSTMEAILNSGHHFVFGQYHASSLHTLFIPFIGIIFLINLFSKKKDNLFILLCILNVVISLWFGFASSEILKPFMDIVRSFLPINIKRFHFLTPLIWFILFALSIQYLIFNYDNKISKLITWTLISLTTILMFYKSDFINEYKKNNITYSQFYSTSLFENVEKFIGTDKKTYKVVSIGMHPAIAIYNGFYTLDGYSTFYDLKYKYKFRKIIAPELEKNEILRKYFDNWGSRVYVLSSDIKKDFLRKKNQTYPININLNTSALYGMGGRYILSTYEIKNYKENNLEHLNVFDDPRSIWKIYLYRVDANLN
jgi:hypothetical protein